MKGLIFGSLSAVVGLAAATSFAQDIYRPAANPPAFQRVAPAGNSAVTISRPVPTGASVPDNAGLATSALDRTAPIYRAKTLDPDDFPQLMPVGPTIDPAKQPGTVKPMGPVEPLHTPRKATAPAAPPAPFTTTSRPRLNYTQSPDSPRIIDGETVVGPGALVSDDCGVGSLCCDTCVSDMCGARWGHRWRNVCGCCDDPCCLQRPRGWIRGEYLLWGISDQNLPPLLTLGTVSDRVAGAIGQPGTEVLFGERQGEDEIRSGFRIAAGIWLPRRCNWGLDMSFFMLAPRTNHYERSSDAFGSPFLARPYFNPLTNAEDRQIVSTPVPVDGVGPFAGAFMYESTTRFWGVDANLRRRWSCGPRYWLDGVVGYRHLNLADTLDIRESPMSIDPGNANSIVVHDHFGTRNSFNGLQLGLEGEFRFLRRWFLASSLKVAVGNVHQIVNIDGSQVFLSPGAAPISGRGGLYALASNIGRYERDRFAVAPEVGLKIGFDINDHWRVYAGYNLLYLSSVVRAGDQIDRNVDFRMVPEFPNNTNPPKTSNSPAVLFRQSDFWAQGGQFGVEYHW